ncbi:DUF3375 domain-containing protein [Brachybacterium vulturis]|uniref:DUF3375 domain-containing protein n=1 Tax=Brachybacterium vulturis TaxID=2017484 RepID=UPI0037351B1C
MTGVARALENRALFEGYGVLKLLRTDHAPTTLGLLGEHLAGNVRTRTAADLYDLLTADLEELRFHGLDLPRTAQQYCASWVSQGFLTRRAAREERTEEFALTEEAHGALRVIDQLHTPRDAVTRSRLALLTERLAALARDTDPDAAGRLDALRTERDRLEEQIATVLELGADPLPPAQALEAAEELYSLAIDVPSDFTRVRGELERLHRRLRLDLVEHEGSQGEILEQLFLGVDAIEDSEAGRSFAAFHSMLIDPIQESRFHEAVDALASRPFVARFGRERILYLQSYLSRLQRESHQVRHAMIDLSRSLREFVRSRQFEEFRALADRLRRPQRIGLEIAPHVRPHMKLGVALTLSTFTPRSIGQLRLLVPSDVTAEDDFAPAAAGAVLDLEALRATVRESEIDLAELTDAVDDVLTRRPSATIAEVLQEHPATQGLASIVGLLVLAHRHGERTPEAEDAAESVRWRVAGPGSAGSTADDGSPGLSRSARITSYRFTRPLREPSRD